ncbi:hypothetical protein [Lysinibacillus sp. C5.1]|uniref:hypothetical protein n=1 Tax=Lysinibacillus sp. C5.1 TaxID=2796169 RepID=UPI003081E29B
MGIQLLLCPFSEFDTDDMVKDAAGNKSIIEVSTPEKAKASGFKGRPYNYVVSSKENRF